MRPAMTARRLTVLTWGGAVALCVGVWAGFFHWVLA